MIAAIRLSDVSDGVGDFEEIALVVELVEYLGAAQISILAEVPAESRSVERVPIVGVISLPNGGELRAPIGVSLDLGDLKTAVSSLDEAASRDADRRRVARERSKVEAEMAEELRVQISAERAARKVSDLISALAERDAEIALLKSAVAEATANRWSASSISAATPAETSEVMELPKPLDDGDGVSRLGLNPDQAPDPSHRANRTITNASPSSVQDAGVATNPAEFPDRDDARSAASDVSRSSGELTESRGDVGIVGDRVLPNEVMEFDDVEKPDFDGTEAISAEVLDEVSDDA